MKKVLSLLVALILTSVLSSAQTVTDIIRWNAERIVPEVPKNPSPMTTVTDVQLVGASLTWIGIGATLGCDVYFGTAATPPKVVTRQPCGTYASPTLIAGTKYYWRVVAANAAGTSTSPTWSFTSLAVVTPPPPPPPATCPCSIWPPSTTAIANQSGSPQPVELGVRFKSDIAGFVTGLKFYKTSGNTGTHVGTLWSALGTSLGTATFSTETAGGWQTGTFASPIPVTAGTFYVASYHSPTGNYAFAVNAFASPRDAPPLHVPSTSQVSGGNGVYRYGTAVAFPNATFSGSNYWVDVVFDTSVAPPPPPPPPSSVTVAWDPYVATDNVTSFRVIIDAQLPIAVPVTVCTATVCTATLDTTNTPVGPHQITVQALAGATVSLPSTVPWVK
jgi:hypothetical protein